LASTGNLEMAAEELAFGSALKRSGDDIHIVQSCKKRQGPSSRVHSINQQSRHSQDSGQQRSQSNRGHHPNNNHNTHQNTRPTAQQGTGWSKRLGGARSHNSAASAPVSTYTHARHYNAREYAETLQEIQSARTSASAEPKALIVDDSDDTSPYFTEAFSANIPALSMSSEEIMTPSSQPPNLDIPKKFQDVYHAFRADAIKVRDGIWHWHKTPTN